MSKLGDKIRELEQRQGIQDRPDKLSSQPLMSIIDNATNTRQAMTQARYIQEYLSNGNNGKQAMLVARPDLSPASATTKASIALCNGNVVSALYTYLAEIGADIRLQLGQLAAIAKGDYVKRTTYTRLGPDGEELGSTVIETMPSARDIQGAINLIAKLTGQYDAMRVNASAMSSELKRLYRRYASEGGGGDAGAVGPNELPPSKSRRKKSLSGKKAVSTQEASGESSGDNGSGLRDTAKDASMGFYGASEGRIEGVSDGLSGGAG